MSDQPEIERLELEDELDELLDAARKVLAVLPREDPDESPTPFCTLRRIVERHDQRILAEGPYDLDRLRSLLDAFRVHQR